MNISRKIKQIMLLVGDFITLYVALYLTLAIRYFDWPTFELWQGHFIPFTLSFLGWIIIFYISGLYNLHLAVNNAKFFELTWRSVFISSLLSIGLFYTLPNIDIAPKTNMIIFIFVFAALFFFWRRLYNWMLKSYLPKIRIAIIGLNKQTKEIIDELRAKPHLGYIVDLIVEEEDCLPYQGIMTVNNISEMESLVQSKKINIIILSSDPHQSDALRSCLFRLLPLGIKYISLPNFYETITGKVPIDAINQMWFLENINSDKAIFNAIKRTYDVILATMALIISFPFWPIIALIINLESKGGTYFKQIRAGKNNQPFTMIKFRTMKVTNNNLAMTTQNDVRITRFGLFMRKTRIDEIPQILNILKGEMSFIGPRPERPEFIVDLEQQIPFYNERMLVKPGVTGWDQVSGEYHSPSVSDSLKKLQYDLFYVKNRSLYLDISIILKTIRTVLSREGL